MNKFLHVGVVTMENTHLCSITATGLLHECPNCLVHLQGGYRPPRLAAGARHGRSRRAEAG